MIWLKRISIGLVVLLVLAFMGLRIFIYKAQHGFATYETDSPDISIPDDRPAVLLFSKTTAFRHSAAIEASKILMDSLAKAEGWFLYETEEGGIFNKAQLSQFNIVIWNNSTGPVLNADQRSIFESYIKGGGGYLGIHGAGDFSHNWDWYKNELICAEFSHHPVKNHIQESTIYLSAEADSTWSVPPVWSHSDEWYVFYDTPTKKGANLLYTIDGESIDPNGDFLWMKGKDYGMGEVHPVAWHREVKAGRAFYTSLGHTGATFSNKNFIAMLKESIQWAGAFQ